MKKYLIVGVSLRSRGGELMVFEACKLIKEIDPQNQISLLSPNFNYDVAFLKKYNDKYDLKVFNLKEKYNNNKYINFILNYIYSFYDFIELLLNVCLKINKKFKYKKSLTKHIYAHDIILEIAGISFVDNFGILNAVHSAERMILSNVLKKQYFCLPQSYGPSDNFIIKLCAKLGLNNVSYIMPRGRKSLEWLYSLGLKNNKIHFVPDLAFSCENPKNIDIEEVCKKLSLIKNKIYVCIFFNVHLFNWYGNYIINIISEIIDFIIDNLNYDVILVAHEVDHDKKIDDMYCNNLIYNRCKNKSKIININVDLSANEIKSIIYICNFTICFRFHAMISSLKMSVPPLVIGWGHKYLEIMELFNLKELVLDYRYLSKYDVLNKINFIIKNNLEIRNSISKNLKKYENASNIVKRLIEENVE